MPRSPKRTKSQVTILDLLKQLKEPISAQELHRLLHNQRSFFGLATVYRSLDALKLQGAIKATTSLHGEALYSLIPVDRHHLHCLHCGISIVMESCPVHGIVSELKKAYDFQIYYHTLEFFGVCQSCQQVDPPSEEQEF